MSLKSLAFAAHRLGVWGDSTYRTAMTQYSSRGWANAEPPALGEAERPALLGKAADLLHQHDVSLDLLAEATALPRELLDEVLASGRQHARFALTL